MQQNLTASSTAAGAAEAGATEGAETGGTGRGHGAGTGAGGNREVGITKSSIPHISLSAACLAVTAFRCGNARTLPLVVSLDGEVRGISKQQLVPVDDGEVRGGGGGAAGDTAAAAVAAATAAAAMAAAAAAAAAARGGSSSTRQQQRQQLQLEPTGRMASQ